MSHKKPSELIKIDEHPSQRSSSRLSSNMSDDPNSSPNWRITNITAHTSDEEGEYSNASRETNEIVECPNPSKQTNRNRGSSNQFRDEHDIKTEQVRHRNPAKKDTGDETRNHGCVPKDRLPGRNDSRPGDGDQNADEPARAYNKTNNVR
ncbi:hypothetical protein FQA39_LY01994 [Lamprigera yunnana]|nr:hypothetical protein FQA39_LY01994 [Lamprigera yunnana]